MIRRRLAGRPGMGVRTAQRGWAIVAGGALALLLSAAPGGAAVVPFDFEATLATGPLAGTVFSGSASYDNTRATGTGQEYLSLTSLSFTLDGTVFTRSDIDQGGQAFLSNGVLSYFTAAFFPPPPAGSPVNDIAFGFGGPGIIGYSVPPGFNYGQGSYVLLAAPVPEPSPLAPLALGLLAATAPGVIVRPGTGWRGRKGPRPPGRWPGNPRSRRAG